MEEGTTKGMSRMNPVKFKADVLVQVWLDARLLDALSEWLEEGGNRARYLSEVVRFPLEMVMDNLTTNEIVKMTEDTMEARRKLEYRYNVKLERGNRGRKNLLNNILLSDTMKEEREAEDRRAQKLAIERLIRDGKMKEAPVMVNLSEEVEERNRKIKELLKDVKDLGSQEPLQNDVGQNNVSEDVGESVTYHDQIDGSVNECVIPEDAIVKISGMTDEEIEKHMRASEECYNKVSDEDLIKALKNRVVSIPGK